MANVVYTSYLYDLASGTVNLMTDPLYVMLLSGTYSPSASHSTVADIVAHQSVDPLGAYVSGGKLLQGKTLTVVGGEVSLTASSSSWSPSTLAASGAAIYYSGGATDTAKKLITYIDIGNQSSTNGTFQIVWNTTTGILRLGAG
jgi:hypothetical protein